MIDIYASTYNYYFVAPSDRLFHSCHAIAKLVITMSVQLDLIIVSCISHNVQYCGDFFERERGKGRESLL